MVDEIKTETADRVARHQIQLVGRACLRHSDHTLQRLSGGGVFVTSAPTNYTCAGFAPAVSRNALEV